MEGFRIQNMPFFRLVNWDNEIRNFTFINLPQNHTVGKAIIWQ